MLLKIINSLLILFTVTMGIKHDYTMIIGKSYMFDMFVKWGLTKSFCYVFGTYTIISAVLILFPKTFFWGNIMMATAILMIQCFFLADKNLKSFAIEIPFIAINLIMIYLKHPLKT